MKTNLVLVLLVAIAFSSSSNLAEAADLVVEVENLELSNAEVRDLETASGKVVVFDVEGAEAKGQVELDRGVYKAYLYMFAPDPEQDAVYVAVGETQERVYPSTHSTLTESSSFNLNIREKKKYSISITFGEPGVLLDRLIIQSIPGQAVTDPAEEISGPSNAVPMLPPGTRPRVIATTDGEVDDRSSMVRFLLYSCDFDVAGIVQVNSRFQKNGHSDKKWIEAQLDAYEQILPNLRKHNPNYPDASQLRSVLRVGNENINDLYVTPPDMETKNTAGAQLIIDTLLDDDPRPVHVLSWGGANTTASALWKLKTEYPREKFEYAASRIRIYCIWYQDGGGKWIQENIPQAYINEAYHWDNVWDYESYDHARKQGKMSGNPPFVQEYMKPAWLNANVKTGHGPLGAMTPQKYISEGDTPSFLHLVNNGLNSHLDYTLGGWGGRSVYDDPAFPNHITDKAIKEDDNRNKMYWRWVPAAQNDFAARVDWCVKEFREANHAPVAKVKGNLNRDVEVGETVTLAATATDPDGNTLTCKWWQYADADSATANVTIANSDSLDTASFVVPNEPGKQVHIILEVTDNGTPPLVGYQRIIYNIK